MARTFQFDGRTIPFEPGDTLASALHRAGVTTLSRSMKYHRPRGLYCVTGSCASCFMEVDGVPNVPACMRYATPGAEATSQNRIGSAKRDLLGVVDKVYPRGFDPHGAFTRPRILNQAFLKAVRFMSGVGRVPDAGRPATSRRIRKEITELIVGAGRCGVQRAKEAVGRGRAVLLVEELTELGGSARWDPTETDTLAMAKELRRLKGLELWTDALAFGIYGDTVAVRHGDDLVEIRAERITIAPGRHDAWPLFDRNDMPGILSLRGAKRLLWEHGVLPGKRIVGHGAPLPGAFRDAVRKAGGQVVAQGLVDAARGADHVRSARVDGRWLDADCVVCHLPGTPRVELFQQAGCELGFQDGVLTPVTDTDGRTSRSDIYARFSAARRPERPEPPVEAMA